MTLVVGESYSSAEMLSVYSATPADCVNYLYLQFKLVKICLPDNLSKSFFLYIFSNQASSLKFNQSIRRVLSSPLLSLLPGPLWTGIVSPVRVLSMHRICFFLYFVLNWNISSCSHSPGVRPRIHLGLFFSMFLGWIRALLTLFSEQL